MTVRPAVAFRAACRRRGSASAAVLALAVAAPAAGWPVVLPAGFAGPVEPAGPVEAARQTARSAAFSARVEVEWVDGRGRHSTSVDVRAGDGLVRVAGVEPADRAARGASPLVLGDGWLLVARAEPGAPAGTLPPAAAAKYDIERLPGPVVAGRPTAMVVLSADGAVRERLAIDEESGLVLRRELFGESADRPVRSVTVTELDTTPPSLPPGPARAEGADPVAPDRLGSVYRTPEELEGGYRRVGAFRRGPVVHVLYSDGLHGLSLFVQPGRLDRERLPAGGEAVRLGRADALRYTWAGGEIVTWESGPVVRTLVGDAARAEIMEAARSVPSAPKPSALERLRSACRQMAEVLGAG
ncbi:MAG TPA: hypothetical protein VM264_03595 [Acidimicrobiales bacterium]|nr:hypothetical protein [Acidimicrobiales bacterium]